MADVRKLIRSYRANDCLWNDKSSAYYNVALRESAWRRIAYIFKDLFTIDQLKSQIRKLKRYYIHECLAIQNSRIKGYSYVPRYSFFKDLCFLPAMKSHRSANELMGMAPKCQVDSMIHTRSEQQIRAKMRNDQINCIIEDAFLLDNSRDRIPSVHVDFCTKPAYKSHKSVLNEDELEASHEMGGHYSMETNLGDIEQENYNFCKLIQNQNQKDNASGIRAVSGTDRWYPTEHCVSCGGNKCDDDEWKDFLTTDPSGERSKGTKKSRSRNNRNRNYNQSDSTINSKCECLCVCDSKEEISTSSSKWKYDSNNDIPSDFDNDTYTICETNCPSIKYDKSNRYDGNKCGGTNSNQSYNVDHNVDPYICGTNSLSSKYGSSIKSNSNRSYKCDEENWSQCKEEGSNMTDSLYSNWPGPKLCGQNRPKQNVARCKVFPKGAKGHEKQCSGHWRRNNQILCQRLKEELALQKQNDSHGYRKQLKPCPNQSSWERGRRRSSGAEKNSEELASCHCNNNYKEQYPPQTQCTSANCPANKYQYPQQSRPIYMQSARQKLDAQQNYQCQQNYNEPTIVPCPVHYPNYDYKQFRQSQQPQQPQQLQQPQQSQQSQQSQPPPVQGNYPPDLLDVLNENECECESNSADEQLEECTPTATTPTPQSLNDLGEQQIEQPNEQDELIDEIDTRQTVPCHTQDEDNENHPKYLVCLPVKNDRHPVYDPCSSYQQTHERDDCYEERPRESCRSRRRHHRNEHEMDRDMEYLLCTVYKDKRQRRRSDDYRDECEFPRRREENDHECLECPAYREGSSRRRHSYEEETYSDRTRCRKYGERDAYDDCPHRERKSRDYDSCDDDYRRRRSQSHRYQIDSPKKPKREENYYCEKKECPATKRLRSEQTSKTAAEESRRRRSSQSSRNRSAATSKGRSSCRKGQSDYDTEMEGGEQNNSPRRVSDSCRGNTQDKPKSGKCRRSSSQKKRRSATDDEIKNAPHSELSTESKMGELSEPNPGKCPKMCEAAVETDLDMSLRGRKCAKPQNRCTQIDCFCSLDNVEDPEDAENVSCECEEAVTKDTVPRGHGGLSQKPDYNSKRLSQRSNNTNGSPGKAVTYSNCPGNRKRQRSGFENMSKWNNGFTIPPPNTRLTKPVVLKSFLIPPMVAKATMGIIHNHISNLNQLLQNPQGLANKPMVRCLRKKPIPKPSRKNQELSDHKAVVLTRNPFKSIDFNASKREVIVLHPPVKDFRPSKNSFGMADVDVKKLHVPNTEKVVGTQKRVLPKPPPTKPKRKNH